MKKILLITMLLALGITYTKGQSNEIYIGKTKYMDGNFFLIQGTITKSKVSDNLLAWIKQYYLKPIKIKGKLYKGAYSMQRLIIDCTSYKMSMCDFLTYSKNGVALEDFHFKETDAEMISATPNSISYEIISTVCNESN